MENYKFGTWYPIEELKEFGKHVLFKCNFGLVTGAMYSKTWGVNVADYGVDYLCNTPHHTRLTPTHWTPLPPRPVEKTLEEKFENYYANRVNGISTMEVIRNISAIAKDHYEGDK